MRLGLRMVSGLSEAEGRRIAAGRPHAGVPQLELNRKDLRALAAAGALESLAGPSPPGAIGRLPARRAARRSTHRRAERMPVLARPREGEEIVADYASLGLTLGRHPAGLAQAPALDKLRLLDAESICIGFPTAPRRRSPGWSPAASAPIPRAAWCSSRSRTRPAA